MCQNNVQILELLSTELNVDMSQQYLVSDTLPSKFACRQELIQLWSTEQHVDRSWQNLANGMLTNDFACQQEL